MPRDRHTENVLSNATMGFLALVSLFLAFVPAIFELDSLGSGVLAGIEYSIVCIFAIEYGVGFRRAAVKLDFIRNRWRVLDALILVASVVSILPFAIDALRNAPALRLIRFMRVFVLGARSSSVITGGGTAMARATQAESACAPEAFVLCDESPVRFDNITWEALLARIRSSDEDWLFVNGVGAAELDAIGAVWEIPQHVLHARLLDAPFPRFDRLERFAALFVWYPTLADDGASAEEGIKRTALLLVGSAQNVVVLARHRTELLSSIESRMAEYTTTGPLLVRATYALIDSVLRAYSGVAESMEINLTRLEAGSPLASDAEFLDHTFKLRAEIARTRSNLRHLKEVVRCFAGENISIHGFEAGSRPQFKLLADDAEAIFARIDDLHDSLSALVDLRLNVAAFQMNRVMRMLAVLTTLALIPTIAGGLLGMNLADSPWTATLPQVSFCVAAGMALSLYVFAVKGWVR